MTTGIFITVSSNHSARNDFKNRSLVKKQSIFFTRKFFIIINCKMWSLKIVSRNSLFSLTSKDFPITVNDTIYENTKKIKT